MSPSNVTLVAPKYILHCTSHVRNWIQSSPNPVGDLSFGHWWSFVSRSTLRNSTSCPSMNPAICSGACRTFSTVLPSPVFVGSDLVFRLPVVIDAGYVSSDLLGIAGSGAPGLAALNWWKILFNLVANVLVLISSSVWSMSPLRFAVLYVGSVLDGLTQPNVTILSSGDNTCSR